VVLVRQFAEHLPYRQAADAVRGRIAWKSLRGLALTDEGCDHTVLSEFRRRSVAGSAEHLLLDALLEHCVTRKLRKPRGRHRTDATHGLTAARALDRREGMGAALRQALNALAVVALPWLRAPVPSDWVERYAQRLYSARLPPGKEARRVWAGQVDTDGSHRLEALDAPAAPLALRPGEAVEALRRMWIQQVYREEDRVLWREAQNLPRPPSGATRPMIPTPATAPRGR
jgi:transposase